VSSTLRDGNGVHSHLDDALSAAAATDLGARSPACLVQASQTTLSASPRELGVSILYAVHFD
jgi:hypothetical protein